jgi:hypothetical protein
MDSRRPGVTDFVHVGLVVEDLDEPDLALDSPLKSTSMSSISRPTPVGTRASLAGR